MTRLGAGQASWSVVKTERERERETTQVVLWTVPTLPPWSITFFWIILHISNILALVWIMFDCALIWKCSNVELPEAKRYYCHEYDHTCNMTKRNMTNKKNNYDQPVSVQRQFVRFCISKMCRVFFYSRTNSIKSELFYTGGGRVEKYEKWKIWKAVFW